MGRNAPDRKAVSFRLMPRLEADAMAVVGHFGYGIQKAATVLFMVTYPGASATMAHRTFCSSSCLE